MQRFVRFGWIVLVANLGVILWGAYVRATGSGAGCGSHWPLCNGAVVPRAPSVETMIEYSHRLTSGIALLMVLALWIWARRLFPRGALPRRAALVSFLLMLAEAAVGAGLVLFRLVAEDESTARAVFMAVHLMLTFLLLAALCLTPFGVGRERVRDGRDRELVALSGATLALLLLAGASGAVAALGDTLYPAASLADGLRQDFSVTTSTLVRLRVVHPFVAVAAAVAAIWLAGRLASRFPDPEARRRAAALQLLVYAQVAAGVINLALLAPIAMQLVHLLLADLLWIAVILALAATRWRLVAPSHS